jgi:putative peptidoglycan lipid II flippase
VLGSLTLASRVAGLARDVVVGAAFGASASADAFFVAFRIPNLFRRIVAEGAASSAFVPVFSGERARTGPEGALAAIRAVGVASAVWLTAIVLVGMAYAEQVVLAFAPGFVADPEKQALTVELTRNTFPYLLFVGLAAWAMGALNAFRRFVAPSIGPVLFNLAIIACVLVVAPRMAEPVHALVAGVLLGGFLQFAVQWPSLHRIGLSRPRTVRDLAHPAVRRVGWLLLPTIFGGAIYQINILVATIFASLLPDRSVSYLWYADRIFEFPLGIVAVAIGTAALPTLSSQAAQGRYDDMAASVGYSLRLACAVCVPAMIGLWMLSPQIVEVLFERGRFTSLDTAMTAKALRAYSIGLLSVAAVRVLVGVFYAFERPRIPVAAAGLAFAVNVVADLALMGPTDATAGWWGAAWVAAAGDFLRVADLRHAGLALGTGIAATVNAVILFVLAAGHLPALKSRTVVRSALVHFAAALVMALALKGWVLMGEAWVSPEARAWWAVGGGVPAAGAVYVAAALLLGSSEFSEILRGVVRRLQRVR